MAKKQIVSSKTLREQFQDNEVPALSFSAPNGAKFEAQAREFSTGSFGWRADGKITIVVNGKPLQVSVNANFIVSKSKDM